MLKSRPARLIALSAVIGVSLATPAQASGAVRGVTVCHRTHSRTSPYRRIKVAAGSLSSHAGDSGLVFDPLDTAQSSWGDILPDAANGGSDAAALNFAGPGRDIWSGTGTGSGLCRSMTAGQFAATEEGAGVPAEQIAADLQSQRALGDAKVVEALGGSFLHHSVARIAEVTSVAEEAAARDAEENARHHEEIARRAEEAARKAEEAAHRAHEELKVAEKEREAAQVEAHKAEEEARSALDKAAAARDHAKYASEARHMKCMTDADTERRAAAAAVKAAFDRAVAAAERAQAGEESLRRKEKELESHTKAQRADSEEIRKVEEEHRRASEAVTELERTTREDEKKSGKDKSGKSKKDAEEAEKDDLKAKKLHDDETLLSQRKRDLENKMAAAEKAVKDGEEALRSENKKQREREHELKSADEGARKAETVLAAAEKKAEACAAALAKDVENDPTGTPEERKAHEANKKAVDAEKKAEAAQHKAEDAEKKLYEALKKEQEAQREVEDALANELKADDEENKADEEEAAAEDEADDAEEQAYESERTAVDEQAKKSVDDEKKKVEESKKEVDDAINDPATDPKDKELLDDVRSKTQKLEDDLTELEKKTKDLDDLNNELERAMADDNKEEQDLLAPKVKEALAAVKASEEKMEESYKATEEALAHTEGLASPLVVSMIKSLAAEVRTVHVLSVEFVKLSTGEVQTRAVRENVAESDEQLLAEVSGDLGSATTPATGSDMTPLAATGVLLLLVGLMMLSAQRRRFPN